MSSAPPLIFRTQPPRWRKQNAFGHARSGRILRPFGIITALLLLLIAAQSSEVPPPPVAVNWTLSVSALPNARLENERIQVALYSNDPGSFDVGISIATQVPLHAVSSRGWSLLSDKSTWGYLFYEDDKLVERLRRAEDGPIIVGVGGNVGCHVAPSELECFAVVDGNWCVIPLPPHPLLSYSSAPL
jgi:hypothetical protein